MKLKIISTSEKWKKMVKKLLITLILSLAINLGGCRFSNVNESISSNADKAGTLVELSGNPTGMPRARTLTVYAAASLTDAFLEIGIEFEATNPGVGVDFSFAGTQVLRTQLEQGATADIFASADHMNMEWLISENLIDQGSDHDFATNKLVVILPASNPAKLETLQDLAKPNTKLILADASVPAGRYAREVLAKMSEDQGYGSEFRAAVLSNVVSNETDVRQVVTKVELGEADAGIVYVSDAFAASELITIIIPDVFNITAQYPIAILANSQNPDLAAAFISYLISHDGQAIMSRWGFSPGK